MNATIATVLAALVAAVSAIYTAYINRRATTKAAAITAEAKDRESQRVYQNDFVESLSNEVEKLSKRVDDLRVKLTAAEETADNERRRRFQAEQSVRKLHETMTTVEDLLTLMAESDPKLKPVLARLRSGEPRHIKEQ